MATTEQAGVEAAAKVEAPVVIVTGASRGIGKEIALALGKAGCKVSQIPKPFGFWSVNYQKIPGKFFFEKFTFSDLELGG